MDNILVVTKDFELVIPSLKKYTKVEFEDVDKDTLRIIPKL